MASPHKPLLSVVVTIVSDTTRGADARHLAGCLEALTRQSGSPPMEIIVPYHQETNGMEQVKKAFPGVLFIPVADLEVSSKGGSREHHDVLRARGMAAACGDLIALLEDHARPDHRWSANIIAAHQAGEAGIGGAIENGIDRPLNWAVYYCDFGKYQNPVPSGDSRFASDANVSYKQSALESVRVLWEKAFHEVVVNGALMAQGQRLALRPDIVVYQHRCDLTFGTALQERFIWGRSYAMTRSDSLSNTKRLVYATLSPVLPIIMFARLAQIAWTRRKRLTTFLRVSPLVAILLASWSIGEGVGYVVGSEHRSKAVAA